MANLSLKSSANESAAIDSAAAASGVTRSKLIGQAVMAYLTDLGVKP